MFYIGPDYRRNEQQTALALKQRQMEEIAKETLLLIEG